MKFLYEYRTSDNVPHSGVIVAANREAAFAALKAKGIRPGCVKDAPGFFNKLFGKGKRWIAIVALGAVAVLAVAYALRTKSEVRNLVAESSMMPRYQIYGEPGLMESLRKEGFRTVFSDVGECYLAQYAQPGQEVPQMIRRCLDPRILENTLANTIAFEEGEMREIAELKRVVNWMKHELSEYLKSEGSSKGRYMIRLNERQEREKSIVEIVRKELEKERSEKVWDERNRYLRSMGLRTLLRKEEEE